MKLTPKIKSEVNRLQSVLIHEPGTEVEAVTPANVNVALYGDILNMSVAKMEYSQFRAVLKKCCTVYELKDLFIEAITQPGNKVKFVQEYIDGIKGAGIEEKLLKQDRELLFNSIVEGIPFNKLSLTNFLNQDRFAVTPLHNLFFTRDTSFCVGDTLYISKMAKEIRHPEAQFIKGILKMNTKKDSSVVDLSLSDVKDASIEGGDVLVADEDILIIGISERTKSTSIDKLISTLKNESFKYVLAQELPTVKGGAFIHLDMVFTLLNHHECMVYKPVIYNINYKTVLLEINNGKICNITYVDNLIEGLKKCNKEYEPVFCGNNIHNFEQREQWHSGANFFALAPGKVIGYERNVHTNEALAKHGFSMVKANDFIKSDASLDDYDKCVITIEGSELSRGGGGPRCMTMPISRE